MTTQSTAQYIGSYKVMHKIGEGGMALIYKALQPSLKRTVVLKKLKDPNREIINRFKKEAMLSASFHHENLVAIYDFIYTKRSYYLVMEYVDGEDLRTLIDYMAPMPAALAGLLILEIVRGLEYTHARNIIHRDIKPSNILVSYNGDVKLIDFGVARDDVSTRLTLTGMIVGTPAYMAPEQANGEALSARSDLFAVGILLYELLTGVKPFYGESNTEILSKIVRNKYIPPERINPRIPRRFRKIIKKALHRDSRQRYQVATEIISDLEKALSWKVRSEKKVIISRFLKNLDKTKNFSETDSVKMQAFMAIPWQGWRMARWSAVLITVLMLAIQGWRFNQSQLGRIQIRLDSPGFQIQLNDKEPTAAEGNTASIGPLLQGRHQLQIFKPHHAGLFMTDVYVQAGQVTPLRAQLPPALSDSVRLDLKTVPAGAQVFVDGRELGIAPLQNLHLAPGVYDIELRKSGFRSYRRTVRLVAGQAYSYRLLLQKP